MNEKSKHTVSIFAFPAISSLGLVPSQTPVFLGRSEMEGGTAGSCTTWVGAVKKTTMLVFYSLFVCLCMSRVNLMFLRVSFELKINTQVAKLENTKV